MKVAIPVHPKPMEESGRVFGEWELALHYLIGGNVSIYHGNGNLLINLFACF